MQLYHASNIVVEQPVIVNRFATLDFGTGFYTTTNLSQATEFARKVFLRRGRKGRPIVNIYEFDKQAAQAVLQFLKFDEPDKEWLEFIVQNRQHGRSPDLDVDIIVGPVANDDVFETVALFESGQLSVEEAVERFKVKELYNQVLFCNMRALDFLVFIDSMSEGVE